MSTNDEKKNRVKRRKIYKDLDFQLAKDKKTLDQETDDKGNKSQRLKNLEEVLKKARAKGEIANLGVKDIAEDLKTLKAGGLVDATAKLKAKGFEDGGMVVKDKVVAIDKSPNSGLITTKGFGAGRKT